MELSRGLGDVYKRQVQPQIIGEVDKAGRPRPGKAALEEVRIPADVIVVAIGQGVEIQGFDQAGVPIQRGAFVAGLSGQVRDMDSVFAGGDCVTGPATAIRAIAAGKVAAANIDEHLGFIKLGSRVDVYLPIGTEVCVKMGQATTGDQTIIAKLK